jgi:hypothetical protein
VVGGYASHNILQFIKAVSDDWGASPQTFILCLVQTTATMSFVSSALAPRSELSCQLSWLIARRQFAQNQSLI